MLRAAQQQIQRLYERGSLSYPRTESDGLTDTTLDTLRPMMARFSPSSRGSGEIPRFAEEEGAHEALHPMPEVLHGIDLTISEWMLDLDDQLVHRIARNLLRCMAPIRVQEPQTVGGIPVWAQELPWSRPAAGTLKALLEPEERAPRGGVTLYEADEIAFRALQSAGLGRPSSIVGHAEHAAERGVVNADGLSTEGESLLAHAPPEIADPSTSRYIERVIDQAYRASLHQPRDSAVIGSETMDLVWAALQPAEGIRPQLEAALRLEERRSNKPPRPEPPSDRTNPPHAAVVDAGGEAETAARARRRSARRAVEIASADSEPEPAPGAVPPALALHEAANADTVEDSALIRGSSTCRLSPTL